MLVRLSRDSIEDGWITGFVSGYSEQLALVTVVSEFVTYNGFETVRIKDVTEIELPHPNADFLDEALALRAAKPPVIPTGIDLSSFSSLLDSLDVLSLITLHTETTDFEGCYIGVVHSVDQDFLSIFEITPDATYDSEPSSFSLDDITRIDFGGAYEEALLQVANAHGLHVPHR